MSSYPPEKIYQLDWYGPYTLASLKEEKKGLLETLTLYAQYSDHPLYGRKALTYIGKAVDQPIIERLGQHDLDTETVYVANVREFVSWQKTDEIDGKDNYDTKDFVRDFALVSRIEELLIYALWPAGNIRNKSSARHSWRFRLFNCGNLGDIPPEVSGHYTLANAPDPENQNGLS